jgi:single-stranded-DNA-specific exonuclease
MKWVLAEPDAEAVSALADAAGLSPLVARLMVLRGIASAPEADEFLSCRFSTLSDPGLFRHMEQCAGRIRKAIQEQEKIVVYGDYDVDGVTGSSLLYLALKGLGADVSCYIPDRMSEGYGLNAGALQRLKNDGAGLVVSVDCGITAFREADAARTMGLDLIITDHHEFDQADGAEGAEESLPRLPDAYALLHPRLVKGIMPSALRARVSGLTGVGIAFKLAQSLLGADGGEERARSFLDLVTLGTVADVGSITGENRVLVRYGLENLSSGTASLRPGVAALKQIAGLDGKRISVGTVGFTLAPRINASGRLDRADTAFRLLTTESPEEARELAGELDAVNRERQSVEEDIWNEAKRMCRSFDTASSGAIILSSHRWHPGVIGIVASRLVEEFFRPTALICTQNGVGKGSARSIPGFDLYAGLCACADLLLGFGGHKYAAGFSIAEKNIPPFRERLASLVHEAVGPDGFVRTLSIDGAVSFEDLTMDVMRDVEKMAPFGPGNPEPRLGARGLVVVSSRIVGNNHLKLRLRQKAGAVLDAIAFNKGALLGGKAKEGARIAAVFTPRINAWNGSASVELEIRDIKTDKENSK